MHHIIEKRFLKTGKCSVDNAGDMLSVRLTKAEHQVYTKKWREVFAYGTDYSAVTTKELEIAARTIYKEAPEELLNAALKTIFGG